MLGGMDLVVLVAFPELSNEIALGSGLLGGLPLPVPFIFIEFLATVSPGEGKGSTEQGRVVPISSREGSRHPCLQGSQSAVPTLGHRAEG